MESHPRLSKEASTMVNIGKKQAGVTSCASIWVVTTCSGAYYRNFIDIFISKLNNGYCIKFIVCISALEKFQYL